MKGEELKEYLDYCIGKYFQQVLDKYDFRLTDEKTSAMAASNTFSNDTLILTIVNDRGSIEPQIASIYSSNYWDFDLVNALLNQNKEAQSTKRSQAIKRLSLSEVSELMYSEMDAITRLFEEENLEQTETKLIAFSN